MGEHFSASKDHGKAPFLPQHWMAWLGVWVMSWSMNWPICMTRMVLSPSLLPGPPDSALLIARAEGSSTLPALLLRGRSRLDLAYSRSRILWYGVPVLPRFGSLRLLQEPSQVLKCLFGLQVGAGTQGQRAEMAGLVSLLKSDLSPMVACRSVRLLSALMVLAAFSRMLLTSSSFMMSFRGLLNLRWKLVGVGSSTKLVSTSTSSAGSSLANLTLSSSSTWPRLDLKISFAWPGSTVPGRATVWRGVSMMLMMLSIVMGTQQVPGLPSLSSQLFVSRSRMVAPIQLAASRHFPSSPARVKHSAGLSTVSSSLVSVLLRVLLRVVCWGQPG